MDTLIKTTKDPCTIKQRVKEAFIIRVRKIFRIIKKRSSEPDIISRISNYTKYLSNKPNGRVLLVYVVYPFEKDNYKQHKNSRTVGTRALLLARAFNEIGYAIDIINWYDHTFVPTHYYDVIFGMGPAYDRICNILPKTGLRIYYATGAHCAYEQEREMQRARYLKSRRGVWIEPRGKVQNHRAENSDAVI